jgi:two-component system, NarL family, sensor histidine kinase DevS
VNAADAKDEPTRSPSLLAAMTGNGTRATRLGELVRAASAVASQTDLVELLGATVEAGMELTGATYGALGVIGEHRNLLQFVHRGIDEETADRIGGLPQGRGLLGLISREGKSYRLDDVAAHPASVGVPEHHPAIDTFLGVPVRAGDRLFGNLYLANKPDGFSEVDQVLVEALAEIAGSAVLSIRLQQRLRRLAVVEDRERIARDIHDAIIQELFAMGLEVQATRLRTEDPGLRATLRDHADRLDRVIQSLRELIFELRRPPAEQRDLRAEIDDLITRLTAARDTHVEVTYNGVFVGVTPKTVDDVLQLVRESLSNALRHSGAKTVRVEISATEQGIDIEVADDGRGFDLASEEPGLGLSSMGARTDRVGGTLRITTAPGKGTVVSMRVPL